MRYLRSASRSNRSDVRGLLILVAVKDRKTDSRSGAIGLSSLT